jgi:hypothetical protein
VFRRSLIVVAALAALVVAPAALAARVHVRIEGQTRTIFGPTAPVVDASNPLAALDAASVAGEFYFHLTKTSFGSYVDQIGRYPAGGSSGWVFKVNGVSPPVGADAVQLKDGDSVLWYWATFGSNGGPPTLELKRSGRCYTVLAQDDTGKTSAAKGAVLHIGSRRTTATRDGRACIGPHFGLLVRATMDGAVRSNALP